MVMEMTSTKAKVNKNMDIKSRLLKHLGIIEGQIRGVKQMIENDRKCDDILIQISAIDKSLKSLGNNLIKNNTDIENVDMILDLVIKLNS